MVHELKSAGHIITDEQQVRAVIRSLSDSWEHMKVNMTHNESVKTFNDIEHHLELEAEGLEAAKLSYYMADSGSSKALTSSAKGVISITRTVKDLI